MDICKPIVSDGNPVGKGFEQIVLNQVAEAIHIIHFVKNLGDKLVDVHSVGQNKICTEKKTVAIKRRMQTPQQIIQRKHLQHLTTAHWTRSTAVGVGHENGNNLYTFFNSSSLLAFLQNKNNHVTAYFSLSVVFSMSDI